MKIWLTTDTHFGHRKIEEYCDRPSDFEFRIQKGFKVLEKDDVLIHLGDVCMGKDERWHEMMIRYLPCKKWLTIGNHDKKSYPWYLRHGWDFVCDTFSAYYFGKHILFSHEPKPIVDFDLNIHGHFHNNLHRLLEKQWVVPDEEKRNKDNLNVLTPKHKLLALENVNYQPVLLSKFV